LRVYHDGALEARDLLACVVTLLAGCVGSAHPRSGTCYWRCAPGVDFGSHPWLSHEIVNRFLYAQRYKNINSCYFWFLLLPYIVLLFYNRAQGSGLGARPEPA
jgi:hypothetical protein